VSAEHFPRLVQAYDAAIEAATGPDIRVGSASTRVTDFVNRGSAFDAVYVFPPLLQAARSIIGPAFKLSSFHARTVRPGASHPGLHVDVPRDSVDWPLVGFILMVDDFRADNGGTQFVPGSHRWPDAPPAVTAPRTDTVVAAGAAGSLLIFNGSTWHGHGANTSAAPRRSLQGAFIPRAGRAGTDFGARLEPATRARLSPLARELLCL
jgi:ectoine hydroxylase-related dioxygenase (phytanoyl-CoA dioxygenase family)